MSLPAEYLAPRDSLLSRRDPRWRLLAFALLLAVVGRAPGRWYATRIGVLLIALVPFLVVVPFTVDRGERLWEWRVLHVTDVGLGVAAALAMKTVALVTLALTLLTSA